MSITNRSHMGRRYARTLANIKLWLVRAKLLGLTREADLFAALPKSRQLAEWRILRHHVLRRQAELDKQSKGPP